MVEVSFLTCQHAMAVAKPTTKGRVYACGKQMIVALCLGFWVMVYIPKLCLAFSFSNLTGLTHLASFSGPRVSAVSSVWVSLSCVKWDKEPWELDSIWSIR